MGFHVCVFLLPFASPSLFSSPLSFVLLFPSPSSSALSSSSSLFPHHHHVIIFHLHLRNFPLLFQGLFIFYALSDQIYNFLKFLQFSSHLSLQWSRKRSKSCEANYETIFDFSTFWKVLVPSSDLGVGQVGANCETFWRVKSMFTQRHTMPMPFFGQTEQSDPPEKH